MGEFPFVINGKLIGAAKRFEVRNPATGDVVGLCPSAAEADVQAAVAAASRAFPVWAASNLEDRRAALLMLADKIEQNGEALARLLTQEQGKPLGGLGSRFELGACAGWLHYTAGLEFPVEVLQNGGAGSRIEVHRKPVGVVASITPWNWPLMIAIWHIAPALLAGNTVVIKPSPYTPLSTLQMVALMSEVLPSGVVNAIAGDDSIGPVLTSHPDVAKITFTGSTATGRKVMASAAGTLKRLTLELGGNDAAIILPDADPAAIAEGLFWGAFINNGQTCAALKRLYVHDEIYDEVCEALRHFASNVPVGNGLDEKSMLGPIQNRMQYDKVAGLVDSARAAGARIILGGNAGGGPGLFYGPTLIADARDGMQIVDEEQFGPALPIIRYTDPEAALAAANSSSMGLGGSVWSADPERARKLALRLECGIAWVNQHGGLQPFAPFGGIKQSGFGVEFGLEGLKEFTTGQTLFC